MSGLVTGWVLKFSPVKDPYELLVLVVLSECAHDDGSNSFPAVATIADRARISTRKVQYVLRALEAGGHIQRCGATKTGTTLWQVAMDRGDNFHAANWGPDAMPRKGDAQRAPVHAGAPETSVEPPTKERSLETDASSDDSGAHGAPGPDREKWDAVRTRLAGELPGIQFHNFIEPLELVDLTDRAFVLAAPPHAMTSVRERYLPKITAAATAELGTAATVEVRPTVEVS